MSLATKYRPKTFYEVVGQENNCVVLKNLIARDTIPNCMIFSGKSGVGKTTLARIFNKELNQSESDPIEIDGASHGTVETIRDIVSNANERSLRGKYKVIIIDECHVLSSAAWSSLLKTLEEAPKYTVFILCTTELNKIPSTIQNRSVRFNIKGISFEECFNRLATIVKAEQIKINKDTLEKIVKSGNGSMRTALSNLERFAAGIDISEEIMSNDLLNIIYLILAKKETNLLKLLESLFNSGITAKTLNSKLLSVCVDLIKYYNFKSLSLTQFVSSQEENIKKLAESQNFKTNLFSIINKLLELGNALKTEENGENLFILFIEVILNDLQ